MKTTLGKLVISLSILALAIALLAPALAQEKPKPLQAANPFQELFETSMKEKKGLTLYVEGQVIGGGVTKVGPETVELRSQEFSKIVVRIEEIGAVAIH